jgi:glutathione S-transferase
MPNTLYSFRRCPYAIRARLALAVSSQSVFLREIILKNKPAEMLALSRKGTVPVLQLSDGTVVDESLDIMVWALARRDPDNWLQGSLTEMLSLIDENDFEFKDKYADRFPEYPALYYREHAEDFLMQLENRLSNSPYLFGQQISLADMAILPFIRQFAGVDKDWFEQSAYPFLKVWLANFIDSQLFTSVMKKYPIWLESEQQTTFPETQ